MTETVDTLKQRIVGALVLISLAVIFLPMIFDEPHLQESNVIVPVPPRPAFEFKEIEKPAKPEFQRLEFNVAENKVVEVEETISAAEEAEVVAEIDTQIPSYTMTEVAEEQPNVEVVNIPTPQTQEKVKNTKTDIPQVSHLPVFKNVWMVKLGTFSQLDNAYQLRDELRKAGFDGHTKKIQFNGGTAIQVFTGPFVDKSQAEKIKLQVDKKFKIESRVIFFDA